MVGRGKSQFLSEYLEGAVVAASIYAKGPRNWSLTQSENERMILWLIAKEVRRQGLFVFSVVLLPNRVRVLLNGHLPGLVEFFDRLCSTLIDRIKALPFSNSEFHYCIISGFRMCGLSEMDSEFAGCALSPVIDGPSLCHESYSAYNSLQDALEGDSLELAKIYAIEPLVNRMKLAKCCVAPSLEYQRLPHVDYLTEELYSDRVGELVRREIAIQGNGDRAKALQSSAFRLRIQA